MPKKIVNQTILYPVIIHRENDTFGYFSPEFGGVSNYERGVDSFLDELKAKLVKQKGDPESTQKEILATENEITYLESIHENYFIGMNVFRTAKGGRNKISA